MKILVTGGLGSVGQGVVAHLVERGHEVRVVDLHVPEQKAPGVAYAPCDITCFTDLREQMRGMQSVIHLAAYAFPGAASGPEIFRVNCGGTYNVFEAAAQEGIRRVAVASSINALGYNFGVKSFPIEYFPIDEDHATFTTDPYSFSKQALEAIAAYYWRRDGISSTCLRMPLVYSNQPDFNFYGRTVIDANIKVVNDLLSWDETRRAEWLAGMLAGLAHIRAERGNEQPWGDDDTDWMQEQFLADPANFAYLGFTDFWSALSVEDAAVAFEQSLLADFEGSHALYVTEDENTTGLASEDLLALFYPQVTARRAPIVGASALVSSARAAALIGFHPRWRARDRFA